MITKWYARFCDKLIYTLKQFEFQKIFYFHTIKTLRKLAWRFQKAKQEFYSGY